MTVTLRIRTGSRLHLGFLDLQGGTGRRFGSLGVAIDRPETVLEVSSGERWLYEGPEVFRPKVEGAGRLLFGDLPPVEIRLLQAPRAHVGLGSGTQVVLAAAAALVELSGIDGDIRFLASRLDRGRRSAVGVEAFAAGGLILDGGLLPGEAGPPPLLVRRFLPERWRFLLALAPGAAGLSGRAEERALARLPPPDPSSAGALCRLVVMALLPALEKKDGKAFGAALTEIQRLVGRSFAPAQGGIYASPAAEALVGALAEEGALGVGQSSWGPTVFGFFDDPVEAEAAGKALLRRPEAEDSELILASPLNEGARIVRCPLREEVGDAFSRR